MRIVDTHAHFWQLNQNINRWVLKQPNRPLKQDFLPQNLQQKMANQLLGVVHIEAHDSKVETEKEIQWLQCLQEKTPKLKIKHIAYVDITQSSDQFSKKIANLKNYPQVVGIRHILAFENGVDYCPQSEDISEHPNLVGNLMILADNNFIFDCQAYPRQLLQLLPVFKQSKVMTAIEHLGLPIWENKMQKNIWQQSMLELSRLENVFLKLSGLAMLDQLDYAKDIIEYVLKCFKCSRLMYGSNNPVCLTENPMQWVGILEDIIGMDQDIFYQNGVKFYQF